MPRSFAEYAEAEGLKPSTTTAQFFDQHPELVDDVVEAHAVGWSWSDIHAWLKDEHGYAIVHSTGIRKHLQTIGRI